VLCEYRYITSSRERAQLSHHESQIEDDSDGEDRQVEADDDTRLQALHRIAHRRFDRGTLLIAPLSTLDHWKRELTSRLSSAPSVYVYRKSHDFLRIQRD
jgi:hypothetical protein